MQWVGQPRSQDPCCISIRVWEHIVTQATPYMQASAMATPTTTCSVNCHPQHVLVFWSTHAQAFLPSARNPKKKAKNSRTCTHTDASAAYFCHILTVLDALSHYCGLHV
eukprot:m.530901 g.530901  ORF g.530901 m.530901 type:complete len:109 (+) comp22027_c1_seq33:2089-2415(+)